MQKALIAALAMVMFSGIQLLANDAIKCQTPDGRNILLYPDHTWQFENIDSESTAASTQNWPPKKDYNHPPFSEKISADYHYIKKYDKFDDVTVQTVSVKVTRELSFGFSAIEKGSKISKPSMLSLSIVSNTKDWKYLRNSHLIIIADGTNFDLGELNRDGSVGNGYVLEFLNTNISTADFLSIIQANKVECKLFITEFSLNEKHLEALRDFASKLY